MIPLQFIGGGRMAEALVAGLLDSGTHQPGDVAIVELSESRRGELGELFPGVEVAADPAPCDALVLATKPADAVAALGKSVAIGARKVLSIAAGVSLARLGQAAGGEVEIVRAMPNTPALVGGGASAICAGAETTEATLEWAAGILGAVGIVERVSEKQMDAVTGLSGSGPAYVFLVAEALTEAGVSQGLPRDVASRLTAQTLMGSAQLLTEGSSTPAELRAAVTSPGGTTAAGLQALEKRAVRAALMEAVSEASRRSAELDDDA